MQLRYYQEEAIDAIPAYFQRGGRGNPLIAMPTGTGKSLIIGGAISRFYRTWPNQRYMCLTHVKELIDQNAAKLAQMWPSAPAGIYSAGLKSRDTSAPIIFGGVQSVAKDVEAFGHRDLLFVDEAHLIGPTAMTLYSKVILALLAINPKMRVIGLTATPYRLGQGLLTQSGLFTDIVCDYTSVQKFNQLVGEGYIAPLVPKRTTMELDLSSVGTSMGEFKAGALEAASDTDEQNYAAVRETIALGHDRKSWLVFASGIHHAEALAGLFKSFGVNAAYLHSKMTDNERDDVVRKFKAGQLRCVVNNGILTTGFDHPPLDLIVMLRATMSASLWVQMLGRGTRPFNWHALPAREQEIYRAFAGCTKLNCLVLDFAGNTRRLGPINDPVLPKKRGEGGGGTAPVKECMACHTWNHASVRVCATCGAEFPIESKLKDHADTAELIRTKVQQVEAFDVQMVVYAKRGKQDKPPYIAVTYMCGLRSFRENVMFDHKGFPSKRARDWWRKRSRVEPPTSETCFPYDTATDAALTVTHTLTKPMRIHVDLNSEYNDIVGYEWSAPA